jgi:hypothetical protein
MDKGKVGKLLSESSILWYTRVVIMGSAISTLAGIGMAIGCVCIIIIRHTIADTAQPSTDLCRPGPWFDFARASLMI